jgi:hypothetical protein
MRERRVWTLEDLELYAYTLRHVIVDCLDDGRDRREGTAHKAMRRWRELRAMVITLAFFVGQVMKTGRGRTSWRLGADRI